MKLKQRPEDFSVIESYRFEPARDGDFFVYRMDKQKLSTLQAVERLRERFRVKRQDVSFCGLKDKQGRTEQLIAVKGKPVELQDADLRLTFLGRTNEPLSAKNITSNRFSVIVRDLSETEALKVPESVAEVSRTGVVNYFDSQRFGFVKHGQGFIAKDLLRGDLQSALKSLIAHPSELDRSDDAKVKAWFREHWGEWTATPPYEAWAKYRPIIMRLRENPFDFGGALAALDRRMRAMIVFELQSAIWNDSVRRYLETKVPRRDLLYLRYQLGALPFPRALPPDLALGTEHKSIPLLGPDSTFKDPEIEAACRAALAKEHLTLKGLQVPKAPVFHFLHEERPLLVFPGKLRASEPREDEENRGRFKVVLSFTLPPGAYATLVVRRVLWFALPEHAGRHPEAPREVPKPKPPREPKKGFRELAREKKFEKVRNRAVARGENPPAPAAPKPPPAPKPEQIRADARPAAPARKPAGVSAKDQPRRFERPERRPPRSHPERAPGARAAAEDYEITVTTTEKGTAPAPRAFPKDRPRSFERPKPAGERPRGLAPRPRPEGERPRGPRPERPGADRPRPARFSSERPSERPQGAAERRPANRGPRPEGGAGAPRRGGGDRWTGAKPSKPAGRTPGGRPPRR